MDFHVRSDSVDVEQIMGQIRGRIREKRGADYSEAELQHLANLKLEKFLDSRGVRSTLVEAFRKTRVASAEPPTYEFTDETLFESPRPWLRKLRGLLAPILRLFVNPDRVSAAFRVQKEVNADFHRRFRAREEMDPLYYEVVHNLVLEITRLGIDIQNLKMKVESFSSRLDFDERRARSLEGMVQRRGPDPRRAPDQARGDQRQDQRAAEAPRSPDAGRPAEGSSPSAPATVVASSPAPGAGFGGDPRGGDEQRNQRRRRRRRRRRPGQNMASAPGGSTGAPGTQGGEWNQGQHDQADGAGSDDGPDDGGGDDDGGSEDAPQ
jgi:hypothetical protein